MGKRTHVPFDVFSMQVDVPVSTFVRDQDLGWSCGQCPLDCQGHVVSPGDLVAQTCFVCEMIEGVLKRGGFDPGSVCKLNVYHSGSSPEEALAALSIIRERFGSLPVIVPIAVPYFYHDGMMIEIDVFAGRRPRPRACRTSPHPNLEIVEANGIIWVSVREDLSKGRAFGEALAHLRAALEEEHLSADHLISDRWFAPMWESRSGSEMTCVYETDLMTNPDALVFSDERQSDALICDLMFSSKPTRADREASDGGRLKLAQRSDGELLFISGVWAEPKDDLVDQTRTIMSSIERRLERERMSFAHVVKLTAHYVGQPTPEDLHGNMKVRHGYYRNPGPASTGLPVTALLNPDCRISIDVVAVA